MKYLIALLVSVAPSFAAAAIDEVKALDAIHKEAQRIARAFLTHDRATIIDTSPDWLVAMLGGRDAAIASMRQADRELERTGSVPTKFTAGRPNKLYSVGPRAFALVPMTGIMQMKAQGRSGHLVVPSDMLAISEDRGVTWRFVTAQRMTPSIQKLIYPEGLGGLVLPEKRQPTFVPD